MDKAEKQRILEELGGISENIYDELVQDFISQTKSKIAELKDALSNDDFDSVAKITHCIKGSAANLRFTRMQEFTRTMEIAAKERKDKEIIHDCITKLEEALKDIKY